MVRRIAVLAGGEIAGNDFPERGILKNRSVSPSMTSQKRRNHAANSTPPGFRMRLLRQALARDPRAHEMVERPNKRTASAPPVENPACVRLLAAMDCESDARHLIDRSDSIWNSRPIDRRPPESLSRPSRRDARSWNFPRRADAVLLFGPLYHLIEHEIACKRLASTPNPSRAGCCLPP